MIYYPSLAQGLLPLILPLSGFNKGLLIYPSLNIFFLIISFLDNFFPKFDF